MRRDERKAAKKPKRKAGAPAPEQIKQEWFDGVTKFRETPVRNQDNAANQAMTLGGESPGRAEAAGENPNYHLRVKARAILVAARKKTGDAEQHVVDALERLIAEATYEAKAKAETIHIDNVKQLSEAQRIKVVAGFMAQIEAMAKANGGPLPKVIPVSGYVLARVMDTLTKAGYSNEGYSFGKALGMR